MLNIIGSILEIVASFADISVVWFEYDSQSTFIEKKLQFKNFFFTDSDWVHANYNPKETALMDIASIV